MIVRDLLEVLAVSVTGMIIFLAEARISPPNYPSNTTFNFQSTVVFMKC